MSSALKRDYAFDFLKGFLIVLVVFGHSLEMISLSGVYEIIRVQIYAFHMPLFVFISGYFSKNTDKTVSKAFVNLLIPYFILNSLWILLHYSSLSHNIFIPQYAFWYFFSLFFWRISIKSLSEVKGLLLISVIIGLYAGLYSQIGVAFSLSRTLTFFPFFILGFLTNKKQIEKIRSINKAVPILLLAALIAVTAILNIKNIIPYSAYELKDSYKVLKQSTAHGIISRLLIYAFAFLYIFAFTAIAPNKENALSRLGKKTITVYALSSFVIYFCYVILYKFNFIHSENTALCVLISIAVTVITIVFAGNKYIFNAYNYIIKKVEKIIIKND